MHTLYRSAKETIAVDGRNTVRAVKKSPETTVNIFPVLNLSAQG